LDMGLKKTCAVRADHRDLDRLVTKTLGSSAPPRLLKKIGSVKNSRAL
jgi:hypothetical protein